MNQDSRTRTVEEITTRHLFDMVDDLDPPLEFGSGPFGRRTFFGCAGGSFHGPRLHGEVLPVGGDWALFRRDGTLIVDVRVALRTHDDALIHMTYGGRWVIPPELRADIADPAKRYAVDPSRYYFRTNPLFETGSEKYAWLNDIVCVGYGYLVPNGIAYKIAEVT
jgi:uncharacterized protein DUF3237